MVLAAALKQPAPLIALHLTRPAIPIPDRAALGMPSHFEAAKGAYVVRDYGPGTRAGCVIVQGTSAMESVVKCLPDFDGLASTSRSSLPSAPSSSASSPKPTAPSVLSRGRPGQQHVHHHPGPVAHAPLALQQEWPRATPEQRLGQPLAHRRHLPRSWRRPTSRPGGCWTASSASPLKRDKGSPRSQTLSRRQASRSAHGDGAHSDAPSPPNLSIQARSERRLHDRHP